MNLEPLGYKFMALWTVFEMACFFVTLDGNVPVTVHYKFQQSVQMTVVVPRPQFIGRVGYCCFVAETGTLYNCAEGEDSSVQFFGEFVNARRCATTGAGVPTVLFLWSAAIAVHRQSSTSLLWRSTQRLVEVPQM